MEDRNLLPFISDRHLSLAIPLVAYWLYSFFFHSLDTYEIWPELRLHTPKELVARNHVTKKEVIREVIIQQILQTIIGLLLTSDDVKSDHGYLEAGLRIFVAFCILDTWQYFLHRLMHEWRWAYRKFHSRHHRQYVPFAFGALYNHPVEGLLLDTVGAGLSFLITGQTIREGMVFFGVSTLKTVDDHGGYRLPWSPFQMVFPNCAEYHDIHHQVWGIKSNYSQPFFVFWDRILGTQWAGPVKKTAFDPVKTRSSSTSSPPRRQTARVASIDEVAKPKEVLQDVVEVIAMRAR